jgi:hypothetical protein
MRAPTTEQMRALADRAQQWSDRAGVKHKPGQTLVEFAVALRAAADQLEAIDVVTRERAAVPTATIRAILTAATAPEERAS